MFFPFDVIYSLFSFAFGMCGSFCADVVEIMLAVCGIVFSLYCHYCLVGVTSNLEKRRQQVKKKELGTRLKSIWDKCQCCLCNKEQNAIWTRVERPFVCVHVYCVPCLEDYFKLVHHDKRTKPASCQLCQAALRHEFAM